MKFFSRSKTKQASHRSHHSDAEIALAKALNIDLEGMNKSKLSEATYFTCIRILTDTLSKLPLKLYKETSEGTQKDAEHYLYKLLKTRPNKNMSASDFWKTVEFQRNHWGNSVVVIETLPNGKVAGLHPLNMAYTTIWIDDKQIIGKDSSIWYVYNHNGKEYKFRSEEVLHFKAFTPNGLEGVPVRKYLLSTIENLQYGTEYVNSFFSGGLSAKGLLQYTGDIAPEDVRKMKRRFEEMATGMRNVGKIFPVPPGFQFSTLNTTMADAQFLELNSLSIRQIASAFGIKQHMVNDLTGAKFNNVQQQNEEFYRDTLHPIFTMFEQELTYKLLTRDEVEQGYFFQFNVDAILRTTLKERYEAYGIGIDKGFLMPNEARAREDMPFVDGGDFLFVNGGLQKMVDVGKELAKTDTTEPVETDSTIGGEQVE